jgi:transcription antitermination protein NusB
MGLRRKSRELALQFLFSRDYQTAATDPEGVAKELEGFALFIDPEQRSDKAMPYVRQLVLGIVEHLEELDALLGQHSHNWRLERMSGVDRNILRIAAYEIQHVHDAPAQVAINEALEIAKRYSIGDSVAFINGILDAVQGKGS